MNENVTLPKEAKKVDWNSVDLELERQGEKIILPNSPGPMSLDDAMKTIARIQKAEETVYNVSETVQCHFFDGIVAFARALKEKYGYSQAIPSESFFGSRPPQLVNVRTGPGVADFIQVPFGEFKLPNIEGTLQTSYGLSRGIPVLQIRGAVKSKEKHIVMEIVALTVKLSKEQSIYRGRSVILERDESGGIDFAEPLQFFDPHQGHEVPIFNPDTEQLIETAVMAPIMKSKQCRAMKIPLKRGVLFEGPYGTGKTLVSRQVARVANDHDWTFILVKSAQALKYGLAFAKMYQPAVVFAEDIDRIAGNRNEGANDLINEIDGVVGKNDEIITVLTTNFADRIEKAFLRPGRLDAVVSIRPPEKEAVERLIRYYAGTLLDPQSDLTAACEKLAGEIPATIREVVERSKLSMLYNDRKAITVDDLSVSADGMQNHLKLIEDAAEGKSDPDPISEQIRLIVTSTVAKVIDEKLL